MDTDDAGNETLNNPFLIFFLFGLFQFQLVADQGKAQDWVRMAARFSEALILSSTSAISGHGSYLWLISINLCAVGFRRSMVRERLQRLCDENTTSTCTRLRSLDNIFENST